MRRETASSSSSSASSPTAGNPSLLRRLSQLVQPGSSFQPRSKPSATGVSAISVASSGVKAVWLDCDPGHDDAIALLMALHHPDLELLGVSTVAGNAGGRDTFINAVRLMALYRASPSIPVIRGSDCPLVKEVKVDVGIHGQGGLGGVQGLPSPSSPLCQPWMQPSYPKTSSPTTGPEPSLFLYTLSTILTERLNAGKSPIHLAVTGPMTNVALFIRCYPHLVRGIEQIVLMGGAAGVRGNRGALAEFNILNDPEAAAIVFNTDIKVVMAGLNVTHQAIFTAELHDRLLSRRSGGAHTSSSSRRQSRILPGPAATEASAASTSPNSPIASPGGHTSELLSVSGPSDLKRMLSSTLTFFAKTYASEFGFTRGPPVHDVLAIAYIVDPTLFYRRVASPGDIPNPGMYDADPHSNKDAHRTTSTAKSVSPAPSPVEARSSNALGLSSIRTGADSGAAGGSAGDGFDTSSRSAARAQALSSDGVSGTAPKRYRVDVECAEGLACGATVVDFWGDRVEHEGWGRGGRNVEVLENLDCPRLWDIFFQVVDRAETHISACMAREGMEALSTSDKPSANSPPRSPSRNGLTRLETEPGPAPVS
ncbi:nucleoside hydrolase [Testicularia cyperi]|uniref:Nucleoside hydrolase n=1 Tax=Testicularia cyperi TaxID=1882483 RepID=A0A317XT10_9BASI|nr:nucleoside hydrolase [Testicularia cyperi]